MGRICLGLTALVIACSDGSGPSELSALNPFPDVGSVTIEAAPSVLEVGSSAGLTITLRDAGGNRLTQLRRTITFVSSDESVVSVDAAGRVLAVSEGEATVTATCEGKSAETTFSVVPEGPGGPWDY